MLDCTTKKKGKINLAECIRIRIQSSHTNKQGDEMKNADMPAMPTQTYDHGAAMQGLAVTVTDKSGLTKREMMAAMLPDVGLEIDSRAVPGFIGREVNWGDILDGLKASAEVEAIHRVIRADALLAELDRTCQKS